MIKFNFLPLFFLLIISLKLSAQDAKIEFTQEETDWISTHQTLKVANEMGWAPFDFVKDGKPAGYSIDLIQLIAQKTGLNIEFVNGYSWSEIMVLFNNDVIQILPAAYDIHIINDPRIYTSSYSSQPTVLVTNEKNDINSLSDLSNKSIAVIEEFSTTTEIANHYPDINLVPVKNILDALMKVSTGELDGFVESIGLVSYYMESNFIPNLKINSDVQLDKLNLPNLSIAVKKDDIILRDILQKGLESVSAEEMKTINEKWILIIGVNKSEKAVDLTSLLVKTIIGVILLFVIFYFGFKWLFKRIIKENIALEFGSRKFRIKTNFYLSVLVIVIAGVGWISITYIESKFSQNIELQLKTDRNSANGRLNFWLKERKDYLKSLGQNQKWVDLANDLMNSSTHQNTEQYNSAHNRLLQFFKEHNYQESYLINRQGVNIGSDDSSAVGNLNSIAKTKPKLIKQVFKGEVVFVPPLLNEEDNDQIISKNYNSLMYFLVPIEDIERNVIAAIIQRIDPTHGFSEVLQLSHVGDTGESYIFNRDGRMLSKSRFENDLKILGVFQLNNAGEPYIEIRNPGGNLTTGFVSVGSIDQNPLTLMAKSAIEGNSGANVDGYNDYRGVPVMGAWMWINELELGLATEIDVEEALELFYFIRLSAIIVLGIALILIIGSILFTLTLGEKANVALIKAKNELEERVILRTTELNNEKSLLDSLINAIPDLIFFKDTNFRFLGANKAFEKQVGFKKEEFIGLTDRKFIPEKLSLEFEKSDAVIINESKTISMETEDIDLDGNKIVYDTKKSPFFNDSGELLGLIGISRDITERKKAEERLKTQSAALKSAANGIVITNTNGVIQWVNPAFSVLTGYTWREVVGKHPRILKSGKHDKPFYSKMWNTILSGKIWQGEIINKKKNGDLYHEEMTITPVFDDGHKISHFVAIKQDISERKQLEEVLIEAKERMENELNIAKDIQMSMLPLIFPAFPKREEIDIYAELIPAREVGGDFYDFHFIDENHICFVMADVSGKGVPAALMMAVTKTLLKSIAGNDKSPASILTHVNNEIAKDNDSYMFITVFLAILNTNTGELIYSNAGHNPSYIIKKETKEIIKLGDLHGPVIGAMEEMTYGETKLFLKKNDIVLSYTDGVTESHNILEELYSDSRFEELLKTGEYDSTKTLTRLIIKSVKEFEGEADQFDDITVMAIEYCQNPKKVSSIKSSIKIINDLKQITTVIEWFEAFALENKMPFGMIQKFSIVFDELLNNIISYAYNDEHEHEIEIEIELKSNRLIITISDEGIPFNPFKKEPPDTMLSVEDRIIGGMGIHLVKNLMDEYDYKRNVNNNIITLVKFNINIK